MKLFCKYNGIINYQSLNSLPKELFRKSIHLCTAFIPFLLHYFYFQIEVLLILAVLGYSLSEFLRLKGVEIPLVAKITKIAARKRDEGKFVLGPVMLVIGIVSASLIFSEENYTIGIFALAFGDGLASLGGKLFGKIKISKSGGKTVAGSLTCFAAIFCSTFAISNKVFSSLIIAFAGMLIEVLPLMDFDNLIIPLSLSFLSFLVL